MKIQMHKSKISGRTIVSLFFRRLNTLQDKEFKPKGNEWGAFIGRVGGFKERENISWEDYQKFVNFIFDSCVPQGYKPTFGMIVSSKVYHSVKKINDKPKQIHEKKLYNFEELQQLLYQNKYVDILNKEI